MNALQRASYVATIYAEFGLPDGVKPPDVSRAWIAAKGSLIAARIFLRSGVCWRYRRGKSNAWERCP